MSTSGSTFTDWQQLEGDDRPLLIDDDFSWSDLPAHRKRRVQLDPLVTRAVSARARVRGYDSGYDSERPAAVAAARPDRPAAPVSSARSNRPAAAVSSARPTGPAPAGAQRPDPALARAHTPAPAPARAHTPVPAPAVSRLPGFDLNTDGFDREDAASYATARVLEDRSGALDLRHSGRRTVIITGRGDSRYTLAPARRRASELRFHERSGFNPDRTAMWAVLLGIALLIGCIAH